MASLLSATLAVGLMLAGCEPLPAGGEIVYALGPPAPLAETLPPDPFYGWGAWMPGHWYWSGYRYQWARGSWILPCRGWVWVPSRGGGRLSAGCWRRMP